MGNRDPATLDWFGDASYVIAPAKNVLIEPELIRRIPIADIPPTPEERLFRQIEKETEAVKAPTDRRCAAGSHAYGAAVKDHWNAPMPAKGEPGEASALSSVRRRASSKVSLTYLSAPVRTRGHEVRKTRYPPPLRGPPFAQRRHGMNAGSASPTTIEWYISTSIRSCECPLTYPPTHSPQRRQSTLMISSFWPTV